MYNTRNEWQEYLKSSENGGFAVAVYEENGELVTAAVRFAPLPDGSFEERKISVESYFINSDEPEMRDAYIRKDYFIVGDYAYDFISKKTGAFLPEKLLDLRYVSPIECLIAVLQIQVDTNGGADIYWAKRKPETKKMTLKPRFKTRDEWMQFICNHMNWGDFPIPTSADDVEYIFECDMDWDAPITEEKREMLRKEREEIRKNECYALMTYKYANSPDIGAHIKCFFHEKDSFEASVDMAISRIDFRDKRYVDYYDAYTPDVRVGCCAYNFDGPIPSNHLPEEIYDIKFMSPPEVVVYRLQLTLNSLSEKPEV